MFRFAGLAALFPVLAGCGAAVMNVVADPTDARILVSTAGPRGTFVPAGRGRAQVTMAFESDSPIVVRVAKDGFATQDFQYGPGDDVPKTIVVKLDTARVVEIRELERTSGGLAVVSRTSLAEVDESEPSPRVGSITRLTNFRNEELKYVLSLAVSPDPAADQVVFELCETGIGQGTTVSLWSVTAGKPGITRLTPATEGFDTRPAFSHDGQHVYFSSTRGGNPMIWRARSTGQGGITRITSGAGRYFDPHVSKNHVVYTEFFGNERPSFLWRTNLDGALPTQLREGESGGISPDGRRIVYLVPDRKLRRKVRLGPESWTEIPITKIWVMDLDGGNPTQLTVGDGMDLDPSWSPDGTKIAYATDLGKDDKGRSNFDIWVMNADGTQPTQITTNGSEDVRPAWDPDGRHIYFRSNRGIGVNIWRMEPAK